MFCFVLFSLFCTSRYRSPEGKFYESELNCFLSCVYDLRSGEYEVSAKMFFFLFFHVFCVKPLDYFLFFFSRIFFSFFFFLPVKKKNPWNPPQNFLKIALTFSPRKITSFLFFFFFFIVSSLDSTREGFSFLYLKKKKILLVCFVLPRRVFFFSERSFSFIHLFFLVSWKRLCEKSVKPIEKFVLAEGQIF